MAIQHIFIRKLLEETQNRTEQYYRNLHESHSIFDPDPPPPPPPVRPPPPPCSLWYIWASVIVVIAATISLIVILMHFCRKRRERSQSLDNIVTNIELQNDLRRPNHVPRTTYMVTQNHTHCNNVVPSNITVTQKF
ncbi:uncharacterized protein LOC115883414 [Sitophilus oryzae]|uniref:Uncharacterized protein LOC115883414 n=1 Tax=Sitophilus oryzae TaxID=7048 RepID=A0A6J2Y3X5_SITOR|nr:uncharacterized protein LOC115883414 [Sitophilus oryzae]